MATLDEVATFHTGDAVPPGRDESQQPARQGSAELAQIKQMLDCALAVQRNLEEQLRCKEQEQRDAARRNDEFLATLAHELKNPLAPIRNGLQLLRLAQGDPSLLEQVHAIMERQFEQINRLIDDLLDVSRISIGRFELRKESVDLASIVNRAVEICRPLIEELGHELLVQSPTDSVMLEGDPERLTRVCVNLLRYAATHVESRGRILFQIDREPEVVLISIRDNGVGIPVDKLPHVFDPYMPRDRPGERGHGALSLEMTLVKQLVELHGGTVEARSAGPGKGSEFVVRLPIREPAKP